MSPSRPRSPQDVVDAYDMAFDDATEHARRGDEPWSTDFPVAGREIPDLSDDSVRTLAWRPPSRVRTWIRRPSLWVRGMWVVLLGTLVVLTIFAGVLAHLMASVTARLHQDMLVPPEIVEEPLPADHLLRDEQRFAAIVAQRPQRRAELELARVQALLATGDDFTALALLDELALPHRLRHFSVEQQVTVAELLARLGRLRQARELLGEAPLGSWPSAERQRALALIGRLDSRHQR